MWISILIVISLINTQAIGIIQMQSLIRLLTQKNNEKKKTPLFKDKNFRFKLKNSHPDAEKYDHSIFKEIQSLIEIEKQLTGSTNCKCDVCRHNISIEQTVEDTFSTQSQSYLNLFTLLTHLILINPALQKQVLGELRIPMLFFRRKNRANKLPRNTSNSSVNFQSNENLANFLMFKCDEKSGNLQFPQIITSYQKILKKIRYSFEKTNKLEFQKFQSEAPEEQQSVRMNLSYPEKPFLHQKYFQTTVPGHFLDSTKSITLRNNRIQPLNYILHKNDKFLTQELQNHKINDTQSFCIFRYDENMSHQSQKNKKYQVFTMVDFQKYALKTHIKENHKLKVQGLDIVCIESYTKVKQMSIFTRNIFSSLLNSINPELEIDTLRKVKQTPVVFYSEYSDHNTQQVINGQLFQLAKLEIELKTNKISTIEERYLDSYGLEAKIQHMFNSIKDEQKKMNHLSLYKTYKIIHFLDLLNIKVQSLRLKWILNQYNQLVLVECLQYRINQIATLFGEYHTRKQKIINHCTDLLLMPRFDGKQDLVSFLSTNSDSVEVQRVLNARRQRIGKKIKDQAKEEQKARKKKSSKLIPIASKSLELKQKKTQVKKLDKIEHLVPRKKAFSYIKTGVSSDLSKLTEQDQKLDERSQRLGNYLSKIQIKKKRYRLKPFKTQGSVYQQF